MQTNDYKFSAPAQVPLDPHTFTSNAIFWIEVEKIKPNPFQPRREFNEASLLELASSIKQYGILMPLVVTRKEIETPDGGLTTEYELIAGERRLRASKLAHVTLVPVVIRAGENSDKEKLELAIIENLQREDLSPIDRALAFQRLSAEFGFTPTQIGKKIGRSREYVSNTIRLLALPEDVLQSLRDRKITEGHARTLLMLADKPAEQGTLHKEILFKKLTVREVERIARKIAVDKVRRHGADTDPTLLSFEKELTQKLGTRVQIKPEDFGGRVVIDYFSPEDLRHLIAIVEGGTLPSTMIPAAVAQELPQVPEETAPADDVPESENEDLYSLKDFSL